MITILILFVISKFSILLKRKNSKPVFHFCVWIKILKAWPKQSCKAPSAVLFCQNGKHFCQAGMSGASQRKFCIIMNVVVRRLKWKTCKIKVRNQHQAAWIQIRPLCVTFKGRPFTTWSSPTHAHKGLRKCYKFSNLIFFFSWHLPSGSSFNYLFAWSLAKCFYYDHWAFSVHCPWPFFWKLVFIVVAVNFIRIHYGYNFCELWLQWMHDKTTCNLIEKPWPSEFCTNKRWLSTISMHRLSRVCAIASYSCHLALTVVEERHKCSNDVHFCWRQAAQNTFLWGCSHWGRSTLMHRRNASLVIVCNRWCLNIRASFWLDWKFEDWLHFCATG